MGELLALLSGKGGTGKTSVCAGLACALAEAGKRVLCIDCDVGLRNLDISLGLADCGALSFLEVSEGGYRLEDAYAHPGFPGLFFLTAPMNRAVEEIDIPAFCTMLLEARRRYDYVLLDAPAGVDAGFRLVTAAADRFLLVTGAGPGAIRDATRVGQLLQLQGRDQVKLIVNRVDADMLSLVKLTVDDVMDTAGLPLMGIVPEDPCVVLAASFGKSVLRYSRRCDAAKAYRRIASRLQGIPTRIPLR